MCDDASPDDVQCKAADQRVQGESERRSVSFEKREQESRNKPLGASLPVYRLSMKLSSNLFNLEDIPGAEEHQEVEKSGFLLKLSSRTFPYIAHWRNRYCVLAKGKLYLYEKADSKANEKGSAIIRLEYYDQIVEAPRKDCKKATNVFVVTSQDRSFFDPGRHLFSAHTLSDMKEWICKLQNSIERTRNNNRMKSTSKTDEKETKNGLQKEENKEETTKIGNGHIEDEEHPNNRQDNIKKTTVAHAADPVESCHVVPSENRSSLLLENINRNRVRGPKGRRMPQHRKSRSVLSQKEKARSLSTLAGGESSCPEPNRIVSSWRNRSLEFLEESSSTIQCSQPDLAYRYSSDEEEEMDKHSLSLSLSRESRLSSRLSYPFGNTDLCPFHKLSDNQSKSHLNSCEMASQNSLSKSIHNGSTEPCRIGAPTTEESPVMDDLDNLLMNQSIRHISLPSELHSENDSDGSTCKALSPESATSKETFMFSSDKAESPPVRGKKKGRQDKDYCYKFNLAISHLQTYFDELDHSVQDLTQYLNVSRDDLGILKDEMKLVHKDIDILKETISTAVNEAYFLQQKSYCILQEAEEIQTLAKTALEDALAAKKDHLQVKAEYEGMKKEMKAHMQELLDEHSHISSPKSVGEIVEQILQQRQRQLAEERKVRRIISESPTPLRANQEDDQIQKKAESGKQEKRSNQNSSSSLFGGYQSFFFRPSALISGLTHKNTSAKTVSFADHPQEEKSELKHSKIKIHKEAVPNEKTRKEEAIKEEKKLSKLKHHHNKKTKSEKDCSSKKPEKCTIKKQNSEITKEETKKTISFPEFDSIPMMDETETNSTKKGISSVTINVCNHPINFNIEKSLSSPAVTKYSPLKHSLTENNSITNNKYKPSPLKILECKEASLNEVPNFVPPNLAHRTVPGISSLIRQSSMTTVPEECTINDCKTIDQKEQSIKRFAQNPPLQRQSSVPLLSVQRWPLKKVSEEGGISRQNSLLSVPEERPIVDQTLPLSPSPSMVNVPLSPSPSTTSVPVSPSSSCQRFFHHDIQTGGFRTSMEQVTGEILTGSSLSDEGIICNVSTFSEFMEGPLATSTLKKKHSNSVVDGVIV